MIPRFSLSHDTFQPADSAEYLVFSTRRFELPADRPATFAVDFEGSKRVFAVCGTAARVLALHEQLGAWGAAEPFTTSSSRRTRTSTTTSRRFAGAR